MAVGDPGSVTFVPHDAPDHQAVGTSNVRQLPRRLRFAATTTNPDIDVDQYLLHAAGLRGSDSLGRIHRDRDACVQTAETGRVQYLVREQQVIAEAGGRHSLDFTNRGAREVGVSCFQLPVRKCRAFVRFHVWSGLYAGPGRGHLGKVGLERLCVNQEGGCLKITDQHRSR